MANPKLKAEARRLRIEEGLPLIEICRRLDVAKGTVSGWLRDIPLTPEQLESVKQRKEGRYRGRVAGAHAVKAKFRKLREQYQQEGREKAKELDPLHIAGCMLYWGEGNKNSRHTMIMTNSDEDMLIFYMQFLRECLSVTDNDITIYINCYTNNGLTLEVIENYWLEILNLPQSCLRKSSVNKQPKNSQQKGRKLLYGTCRISIHNVQLLQQIYGAIQEYSGIDKPEWLL